MGTGGGLPDREKQTNTNSKQQQQQQRQRRRLTRDHPPDRRRHQHVAGRLQELVRPNFVRARVVRQLPAPGHVRLERLDVEPLLVDDRAARVRHGLDLAAVLLQDLGRPRPDVPEALDHEGLVLDPARLQVLEQLPRREHGAAAGGGVAAEGAVEVDGLAGDDAGGEALVLGVLVKHPRHDLSERVLGCGWSVIGLVG